MKVLVTGGAGYLGTTLVPRLLGAGHHVTVFDTFAQGMPFLASCCASPKFTAVQGDVRDHRAVRGLLDTHDAVINLAGLVGAPVCDRSPMDAVLINQNAVEVIARALSRHQLLLQPTSDSGYGIGYQANVCTEEHPLNPTSLYACTKVNAEKYVLDAGGVSLRLASVFGMSPRMRLDLIVNEFVWRAVHDRSVVLFEGNFRRNFVHVRDVAAAFVHAIEHYDDMGGNAFNCGRSAEMMTKRQLCDKIARHIPWFEYHESETAHDPDRRDFVVSNEKLEATGWQSKTSLDAGIIELVKGYTMMSKGMFFNG